MLKAKETLCFFKNVWYSDEYLKLAIEFLCSPAIPIDNDHEYLSLMLEIWAERINFAYITKLYNIYKCENKPLSIKKHLNEKKFHYPNVPGIFFDIIRH